MASCPFWVQFVLTNPLARRRSRFLVMCWIQFLLPALPLSVFLWVCPSLPFRFLLSLFPSLSLAVSVCCCLSPFVTLLACFSPSFEGISKAFQSDQEKSSSYKLFRCWTSSVKGIARSPQTRPFPSVSRKGLWVCLFPIIPLPAPTLRGVGWRSCSWPV